MAHMTKTATPPTTPPMIAPRFEDVAPRVLDEVLDGDALDVTPVDSVVVDVSEFLESGDEVASVTEDVGVSEPVDVFEVL